ncbi:MAG: hypothetical protein LUK37_02545, partial [Clostridia bacterium]|nr:hypothetical protein [Clostridia bacterium]
CHVVICINHLNRERVSTKPQNLGGIHADAHAKYKKNNVNGKFTGYLKQMEQGSKGVLYDKRR